MWNAGVTAYTVNAVPNPSSPQRALRRDALTTLAIGAIRIARRGAGRCVADDCPTPGGTVVWKGVQRPGATRALDAERRDFCSVCERRLPPSLKRAGSEAERVVFDGAVGAVLGGPSRAQARRKRSWVASHRSGEIVGT